MATRILGINGTLRPHSSADRALRYVLRKLELRGAEWSCFDIAQLPLLDGRPDDGYPPGVAAFREACYAADALVIATPSYHGALPGGLKNALDFLDEHQVGGKPFMVVGIANGDAEPAVTDVARVMRHIQAAAVAPDIVVSKAAEAWGKGEEPADPFVAERIAHAADRLIELCEVLQRR